MKRVMKKQYYVSGQIYVSQLYECDTEEEANKLFHKEFPTAILDYSHVIDICEKCEYYISASHNHRIEDTCKKRHYTMVVGRKYTGECKDFKLKETE